MLRFLIYILFALALSVFQYIGGRIILPEMGLTAPGLWAWFWLASLVELPILTFWAIFQAEIGKTTRFW